jgi:SAM-dependent methyltransferase
VRGVTDATRSWSDSMPLVYEELLVPTVFQPFALRLAERVALLRPQRVLELAAGTGVLTRELVRLLPSATVVAPDLNDAMVRFGSARLPEVEWRTADAMALPFDDASFDVVVCQFGVMFFPDRIAAYEGIRRVIAPDGAFLFNAWAEVERHAFEDALVRALHRVLPDDPPTFMQEVPHGYHDPGVIERDVRAAGFTQVDLQTVEVTGQARTVADLGRGYCHGTPLRSQLVERGDLADLERLVVAEMQSILGTGSPVSGHMAAHEVLARA